MRSSTKAALALVQRADPVPLPPPVLTDQNLTFHVNIKFSPAKHPIIR
jgi:outer membrane biosynthesis protein TonB